MENGDIDIDEYHLNLDRLFELVNLYNDKIIILKKYLRESKIDRIKTYLKNDEKTRARKRGISNAYKNEISLNEEKLNNTVNSINNYCTFNFKYLTWFLAEAISIKEGETYIKTNVTTTDLDKKHFNNPKSNNIFNKSISFNYVVIAPYDKIKQISELKMNQEVITFNMLLNILSGSKFVILEKCKKYNIYDEDNNCIKNEIISDFSYLNYMFKDIITAKINGLTDDEIFYYYVDGLKCSNAPNLYYKNHINKSK